MTCEPKAHAKLTQKDAPKKRSVLPRGSRHLVLPIVTIGVACGAVASMGVSGSGNALSNGGRLAELGLDWRPVEPAQHLRAGNTLDTLQRLPESVRASLRATKTLSPRELCRVAETLVQEPATSNIDVIAHYLSKDVYRWSDRMISLYLNSDPRTAKATDRSEMKKRILQKWESDRGIARRWIQGCGVIARASIGRGLPVIEREGPDILADVVAVIAVGLRKHEPDAIAAAEALVRTEEALRTSLK